MTDCLWLDGRPHAREMRRAAKNSGGEPVAAALVSSRTNVAARDSLWATARVQRRPRAAGSRPGRRANFIATEARTR